MSEPRTTHDELVAALRQQFPGIDQQTLDALAASIDAALDGEGAAVAQGTVAGLLRQMAERRVSVKTRSAQLSFGDASQTGEVQIRDVAGGNITNIHVYPRLPTSPGEGQNWLRWPREHPWWAGLAFVGLVITIMIWRIAQPPPLAGPSAAITDVPAPSATEQPPAPTTSAPTATEQPSTPTTPAPTEPEPTRTPSETPPIPTQALDPTTITARSGCPDRAQVDITECLAYPIYEWKVAANRADEATITTAFTSGSSDGEGRYYLAELSYELPRPGTYAGIALTFRREWQDLTPFEAIEVRVGFQGELDRCRLYLKPYTTDRPDIDSSQGPPPDRGVMLGSELGFDLPIIASPLGLTRTVIIPLRQVYPNTPLDKIKEIGVIAGVRDSRPTSGLCRIYSLTLLKTMPASLP